MTNNTDGAALLPVTQADKDLYSVILNLPETNRKRRLAGEPIIECVQLLAAHRLSHSLPGDVGMREAIKTSAWIVGDSSGPLRAALDGSEVRRAYTTAKDRQYRRWSEA